MGGLFVIALLLLGGAAACGPPSASVPLRPDPQPGGLPDPLAAYRGLGFLAGTSDFPAVGQLVHLPGPDGAAVTVLSLSLPNSALRFRREAPGFLARYRVQLAILQDGDTIARLDETQTVRVRSFRETSRTDESIIFQGFLRPRPGTYLGHLRVSDEGSPRGFQAEIPIEVPAFAPGSASAPVLVHQAVPRSRRDSLPGLIARPLGTLALTDSVASIYVEAVAPPGAPPDLILEARIPGSDAAPVWADTLSFAPGVPEDTGTARLVTRVASLEIGRLPPGGLRLGARLAGRPPRGTAPLIVAALEGWPLVDYDELVSLLRYAGTPEQIEGLSEASAAERASRFRSFWRSKDPVPATPQNEFFVQYFRRLREADDRFAELGRAGWRTDRGAVYTALGPPDEVFRHLDPESGAGRTQIWRYDDSLGFDLRLVFVDEGGAGSFRLSPESRRSFEEAVRRLHY